MKAAKKGMAMGGMAPVPMAPKKGRTGEDHPRGMGPKGMGKGPRTGGMGPNDRPMGAKPTIGITPKAGYMAKGGVVKKKGMAKGGMAKGGKC